MRSASPTDVERLDGPLTSGAGAAGPVDEREHDVVERGHPREQVEGLEHEPDPAVAQLGELGIGEVEDVPTVVADVAGRRDGPALPGG
jgi:hypothetical protein